MRRTTSLVARRVSGALAAIVAPDRAPRRRCRRIGHARHQPERRRLRDVDEPAGEQQVLGARRPDRGRRAGRDSRPTGSCPACARWARRIVRPACRRADRRSTRWRSRRRPPRREPGRSSGTVTRSSRSMTASIRRSYAIPSSPEAKPVNWRMSVPATKASPAARSTNTRTARRPLDPSQASTSASYMAHVMRVARLGTVEGQERERSRRVAKSTSEVDTDGDLTGAGR